MAHMVKVFAARPDDPSPRSGICTVEGKVTTKVCRVPTACMAPHTHMK